MLDNSFVLAPGRSQQDTPQTSVKPRHVSSFTKTLPPMVALIEPDSRELTCTCKATRQTP